MSLKYFEKGEKSYVKFILKFYCWKLMQKIATMISKLIFHLHYFIFITSHFISKWKKIYILGFVQFAVDSRYISSFLFHNEFQVQVYFRSRGEFFASTLTRIIAYGDVLAHCYIRDCIFHAQSPYRVYFFDAIRSQRIT